MPKRLMRLDLSADARDFEVVALEPGIPLLDKPNANFRVVQKWLGRFAAEPQWHGDSVDLFVCDDQERWIHDVRCEPARSEDLRKDRELRSELDALKEKLAQIKPESPSETRIRDVLDRHFRKLTAGSNPSHQACHFFRYRDQGRWRLVWGWGYQRKDLVPAPPVVCTNPNCSLLFVRRRETGHQCPACAGIAAVDEKSKPKKSRTAAWIAAIVLAAAGAALAVHLLHRNTPNDNGKTIPPPPPTFIATPNEWSGPSGARVDFSVARTESDGKTEDVTHRVVVVVEHPKIVRLDRTGMVAHAQSPGDTAVHFYLGSDEARATLHVDPPKNPSGIKLNQAEVTLGLGATQLLQLIGEYDDGRKVDLTDAAEWDVAQSDSVRCYRGLVEGVSPGEATLAVRYRATEEESYLQAEAKITVTDEPYESLVLALEPVPLISGKAAQIKATAATASGKTHSVVGSSQLQLQVEPADLAQVEQGHLRAQRSGQATLKGTLGELTASLEFKIEADASPVRFEVKPKDLRLIVGETAALDVVASDADPVGLVSSDPDVAEVIDGHRIVGRSPGKATITATQEARQQEVSVEVVRAELESIRFVPSRATVKVDDTLPLRLVGRYGNNQEADLAADQIVWERLPSSSYAEFDLTSFSLRGIEPTLGAPQTLTARCGELRATAVVEVVAAAVRVELAPQGPTVLPVEQVLQLHAWGNYGDGRRVELAPAEIVWTLDPEGVEGLKFDPQSATVRAELPGVGPVRIFAEYQGFRSNSAEFSTVDKAPITLALKADRTMILVDDTGVLKATTANAATAPQLMVQGLQFASSEPELLEVDRKTGAYRGLAAGKVTVTVNHPAAEAPATLDLQVLDRDDAKLVLRPAQVTLGVGQRRELKLVLAVGDSEEPVSVIGNAGELRIALGQPKAVAWKPPFLIGVAASDPFEISASYRGKTARGTVEVVAVPKGDQQPDIRIVPATAELAPGQTLSVRVEQRIPNEPDAWQEIDARQVSWDVPPALRWTAATDNLRPQLTVSEQAEGKMLVEAKHGAKKATLEIQIKQGVVSGMLVVVREPEGQELPVGMEQRYTVMVDDGERREPAVGVRWETGFENQHVRWNPPVLSALKAGHEQLLTAWVGDERVAIATRIVGPAPEPLDEVPLPDEKPTQVRIFSGRPQPIQIPLTLQFSDFRVEAAYAQGPPRDVTGEATLKVESEASGPAPLVAVDGQLAAQKVGKAVVQAEYNGVRSAEGLSIEVVGEMTLSDLALEPDTVRLSVDETVDLKVIGFTGTGDQRQALGDVSSRGDLQWASDNPEIARADGPVLTGVAAGDAVIRVSSGDLTAQAQVTVVGDQESVELAEELELSPKSLRMQLGETKWIGRDVTLSRGSLDFGNQAEAVSSAPEIVRYDPGNRSLTAISPGKADVALTLGDRRFSLPVEVAPGEPDDEEGTVVIEPDGGTLAVGQGQDLRVFLVTKTGQRIDQTSSALLQSSDEALLGVSGGRVTGMAPGEAQVVAGLPGSGEVGTASFVVQDEAYNDLLVTPAEFKLAVGDEKSLRIVGSGPQGRVELADHPDLKITVAGELPEAVELIGAGRVRGVAKGQAEIHVGWQELPVKRIPVQVTDDPISQLRIEPPEATAEVGRTASFLVFAKRGNQEKALSGEDGVELHVGDQAIAQVGQGLTVSAMNPGETEVTARVGSQSAVAKLNVIAGRVAPPRPPARHPVGLRFIPDILRLQLGVPGAPVRVVRVLPDGSEEDVDHRSNLTFDPDNGIVDLEWTASGPVFEAQKEGQTRVNADQGGLATHRPLLIQVIDPSKQKVKPKATLKVDPDPLRLVAGRTGGFSRVQIDPGAGSTPIDVDYRVESTDDGVVTVEGGKLLRAVAEGGTQVVVKPVDAGEAYQDLSASVGVQVDAAQEDTAEDARLVLSGPSRITVGAEADYRVELATDSGSDDVTHEATTLVLDRGDLAEVRPGCVLVATQPGTVTVQARHKQLISDPLQVRIDQVAGAFERLDIDIEPGMLAVGESRSYRLWGYPVGDGPRQDLTNQIADDPQNAGDRPVVVAKDVESAEGTEVVVHTPPTVTAKSPGRFHLSATLGEVQSDTIDLEVVDAGPGALDLQIDPSSIAIQVGEKTPRLTAMARQRPGDSLRPVEVAFESEDLEVLGPDPELPGVFVGKSPGSTRVKASFQGQEAFVDVTVVGTAFSQVKTGDTVNGYYPGNHFDILIFVDGVGVGSKTEYRVSTVGSPEEGEWKAATSQGNRVTVQLTSPKLRQGPPDTVYHLIIEARDPQQESLERYPLSIRLTIRPEARP